MKRFPGAYLGNQELKQKLKQFMEKKVKVLLWTIIGIIAAILVGSIILAFTAPGHLLTLWIGLVVGGGLCTAWIYRKSIKSILDNFVPLTDENQEFIMKTEVMEEEAKEEEKVEEPKKVEEKKPATKRKRNTSKKK